MKRKYIALILAAGFALGGCSDKKNTDSSQEDLPGDTTLASAEEPEEDGFLELTEDDFTRIEMNLNISEDPPPVEIHSANLGKLDFGERLSPCKAPEYRDAAIDAIMAPTIEYQKTEGHSMSDKDIEEWRERLYKTCERPSFGDSFGYTTDGEKLYCVKNFDDLCQLHDTVFFSVDLKTSEIRELFSHEDPVETFIPGAVYCVSGKLLYVDTEYKEEKDQWGNSLSVGHLMAVDTETGERSELCSGEYEWINNVIGGKVILGKNYYHEESSDYLYTMYDIETGELTELSSGTYAFSQSGMNSWFEFIGGVLFRFDSDYDKGTTTVSCDEYSVTIDHCDNLYFQGATKDRIMVVADEYSTYMTTNKKLYTYDLKTRECLVSNFSGFGNMIQQAGDALVAVGSSSGTYQTPFYYILPQIGTAFKGEKLSATSSFSSSGNTIFIIDDDTRRTYYNETAAIELGDTKVYWFEIEEDDNE